jgi:hypothetical protein
MLYRTWVQAAGRLFLVYNPQDHDKLKEIFTRYLPYLEKEPETFLPNILLITLPISGFEKKPLSLPGF